MKAQVKVKKNRTFFRPRKSQKDFLDPEIQRISWSSQSFGASKAQVKVQEMAFVLLALALLAMIAFIFFIRFQSGNIEKAGEEVKRKAAISLLEKIATMQEISCQKSDLCIDEDKLIWIDYKKIKLDSMFQGIKNAKVVRLYPKGKDLIIYDSGAGNQSYSTFVNLCWQEKVGMAIEWRCGIAMLVLEY